MRRKRRSKPAWDLYRDGISYSLLSRFVNCRERFRIYTVEGLRPADTSDSMDFGTMFHSILEEHAQGRNLAYLKRKLQQQAKNDPDAKAMADQCLLLFKYYEETWRENDAGRNYISQEEVFRVPVYLPSGRKIDLRGRYDEIYRENGAIWLQENKTKAHIDELALSNILAHDLQTMLYCYTIKLKYKEEPRGVLYNVIRRPLLKQKQKETDLDFLHRIEDDIKTRPEHYFVRFRTEFGDGDVEKFCKRTLFPLLESVCVWWESIKANPFNPWTQEDGSPNLHHYERPFGVYDSFRNGKGDYFDLITRGVDSGLELIETVFPELEEPVVVG